MVVLKFLKNLIFFGYLFCLDMKFYFIYGNDKSYRFCKILDECFRYIYLIVEILWKVKKYEILL